MRNLFTKYPVISWMSVGYVLYSLLPFIGMAIGDSLGEYVLYYCFIQLDLD
jgi:hypothetical protein